MSSSSRLMPLPPEHTPELHDQFESFKKTLGFIPNSALTMQRLPKLAKAFAEMSQAIYDPAGTVDRGTKRLIAHVAARAAGCRYCMAHTASGALHFGVDGDKLADVWNYEKSPLFNAAERSALEFAIAASSIPNAITDESFTELRKHWSEDQITEIVAVIAMMGFLTRWNDTIGTPLEAAPLAVGEKYLAPQGWAPGKHRR
jgi:uncharacterized peroxidase-related enzyme